jgi:hypothetical protein
MNSQTKDPVDEDGFWPDDAPELPKGKVVAAVLVIVLLLAGGGVWFFLNRGDDAADTGDGQFLPKVYVPQPAGQDTAKLNQRATDSRPFSEGEVFGEAKEVSYRAYKFTLTSSKVTECVPAVWGARLMGDLSRGQCTQIARGAYLSADKKYAGQFAAINMADVQGAQQVLADLDPATKAGFVKPLPIEGVERFGSGFSAAYPQAIGHYVILSWVQLASGGQPQTLNEMIDASLAVQQAEDFAWGRLVLLDPSGDAEQ